MRLLHCPLRFFGLVVWLSATPVAMAMDPLDNQKDWAIYRGDKKGIQFTELDQVTPKNVQALQVAWVYRHGDPSGPSMYSNPIIIDGKLYFTTPTLNAVALDAATGEELWVFEAARHQPNGREVRGRNRGVVFWQDAAGKGQRIFHFVKDRLYALDAATGERIASFGDNGYVDLRRGLPIPAESASVEVTTPGIVYENFLIVGSRVPEGNASTPGDIRAYDTVTGEQRWIFHTIPHEGELGHDTWEWEPGETYGGANPWGGFTVDEERGWVFCATGSAAGDFIYGGTRKGENLFANCVLALEATTGRRVWHYQTIHHDIFDYDNPPAPVLATQLGESGPRDVAVQLTKMGLTFVLDRETGEPVFPVEERPVPPSLVPGEAAWPTQPFPQRPPSLVRHATFEADLTNISEEAHRHALEVFRRHRSGGLYTPASLEGTITTPGHQGGVEWGGAAFDPETGVLYVNANEAPTINQLIPLPKKGEEGDGETMVARGERLYLTNCSFCHGVDRRGVPPLYPPLLGIHPDRENELRDLLVTGRGIMPAFSHLPEGQRDALVAYVLSTAPVGASAAEGASASTLAGDAERSPHYGQHSPFFVDHEGYPAISPPWGTLNAVDLNRGELLWKVPLGEYPKLAERGIRNTGAKNFGGPVLTASGLIFIAATPDEKIRAFDKYSGRILWEHPLPAGGYATPSVFEVGGRQMIVIAAGGGGKLGTRHGDAVVAFALPEGEAREPRFPPVEALPQREGLPDPMTFLDGDAVETRFDWVRRRSEMRDLLLHYQYGELPSAPGGMEIDVTSEEPVMGGKAVDRRVRLRFSEGERRFEMRLGMLLPKRAGRFPAIIKNDVAIGHIPIAEQLIEEGFITVEYLRTDLDPDEVGVVGPAQAAFPEAEWGTLAVWAWGGLRVIDYLETLAEVRHDQLAAFGHSRGGKVALLMAALDERVAVALPNGSGAGGAGLYRKQGRGSESLAAIADPERFAYWFHPRLGEFAGREDRLPFDQHFLRALVAPRAVFSTDAEGDRWANPEGTRLAQEAAQTVYDFLGAPENNRSHFRQGEHNETVEDWEAILAFLKSHFQE